MHENDIKNKLAGLSDSDLYKLINAVCIAAGMDRSKADTLTSDIPRLRRMLTTLSDKQISTLMASLGANDAGEMLKRLGNT